jgi:hypothetical protein
VALWSSSNGTKKGRPNELFVYFSPCRRFCSPTLVGAYLRPCSRHFYRIANRSRYLVCQLDPLSPPRRNAVPWPRIWSSRKMFIADKTKSLAARRRTRPERVRWIVSAKTTVDWPVGPRTRAPENPFRKTKTDHPL